MAGPIYSGARALFETPVARLGDTPDDRWDTCLGQARIALEGVLDGWAKIGGQWVQLVFVAAGYVKADDGGRSGTLHWDASPPPLGQATGYVLQILETDADPS